MSRSYHCEDIARAVSAAIIEINYVADPAVLHAFERVGSSDLITFQGLGVIGELRQNAELAASGFAPLCQDTGIVVAFVALGQEARIEGGLLAEAIQEGVRRGYRDGYLRKSVVGDPVERINTKDNTPAVIHYDIVAGDGLEIEIASKGIGSENMSAARMLTPAQGAGGIVSFAEEVVRKGGSNPCPPIVLGIGVGGTLDKAAVLAKKALFRPLGQPSDKPHLAELEQTILERVNALGIGPMGLGGAGTALAVHIESYATHIAGLPVVINLNCHSSRHKHIDMKQYDESALFRLPQAAGYSGGGDAPSEMGRRIRIAELRAEYDSISTGDRLLLSGVLYTARDAAHGRLNRAIEAGEPLPIDLFEAVIYYTGPSEALPGRAVGAAGPTTSYRMDMLTPKLIEHGLAATIGKGDRSPDLMETFRAHRVRYLAATGGAGALLSTAIRSAEVIAYDDLGAEAIRKLEVVDFPVTVIV
ncbi:MAG: fumarate hydratase [Bacillota bacterium]|nr:fumarate hydratase [Bacillota bacterium]